MARTIHTIESLKARTIEDGDCWQWRGYMANNTPQVMHYIDGKRHMYSVRRLFRELIIGKKQPDGHYTNTCGNQFCVNPEHIRWKTVRNHLREAALNRQHTVIDRMKKRQYRVALGLTKLDMQKAEEIRASTETTKQLAEKYGVNISMIKRVRANQAWRVLSGPFVGLLK
jgi:hypothetical protein